MVVPDGCWCRRPVEAFVAIGGDDEESPGDHAMGEEDQAHRS